jgi:predicted phage tail protein
MSDLGDGARKHLKEKSDKELQRQLQNLEIERQMVTKKNQDVQIYNKELENVSGRIEARTRLLTAENEKRKGFYSF